MRLNAMQREAIAHKSGPCMVLAGPGSGKTTVITNRIAYLIQRQKISPEEILVITFSKAAANEMKERYLAFCKRGEERVCFGTFHGIYYGILKWAYKLNTENILSEEEKHHILQALVQEERIDVVDEKEFVQEIAEEIGRMKNQRLCIAEYHALSCDEGLFATLYQKYERERKARRKLDFDDMLVLTYQLFQNRPDILAQWQKRFRYILIDEFQDINAVQYDVIRMLAAPENNLFVVGDDDQSIYGFRGAKPELMLQFREDYPNAKQIFLNLNYRSTDAIVSSAARVISHNRQRFVKDLMAVQGQGVSVHIQEVKDPIEESDYVMREIQAAMKRGVSEQEIAVLFRTNVDARSLMETFWEHNIPFRMKEQIPSLYEHFISRDILTYLKMACGERSRQAFLAVMNRPNRYLSREAIAEREISFESLRVFYQEKDWMLDRIDTWEAELHTISRMAPYGAIQYIRKKIGYDVFLKEYAHAHRTKEESLFETLDELQERARPFSTIDAWLAYIASYQSQRELCRAKDAENQAGVCLMTMHASKGLEFDTVFLIGANEKIIPHKKAELPEELEEERRMFYVAMTRARKRLIVSYTKERNGKKMEASRFVEEIMGRASEK
ncbi:MAG: ATP-dependent helicase [Faecalimonas sp.]|nr:ATP-dependent helicase [Faecalimonas sp.]